MRFFSLSFMHIQRISYKTNDYSPILTEPFNGFSLEQNTFNIFVIISVIRNVQNKYTHCMCYCLCYYWLLVFFSLKVILLILLKTAKWNVMGYFNRWQPKSCRCDALLLKTFAIYLKKFSREFNECYDDD